MLMLIDRWWTTYGGAVTSSTDASSRSCH